ncbi:tetratricopeptide repeat protein [Skermanella mucosa]|uniref:tetratricopeptide repeat protein n=1 Tax=Skermanella mucosa TaxID=1789672 RepID=UPI00192C2097|nr:tetratricopeptide repeat protein [Skermanella mucosa]UEM23213.1 tetratricopeptide repeat protein [Skermanella mucosa]
MSEPAATDEAARSRMAEGRPSEAATIYRRAIAEQPDDVTLYNNMAAALRRTGDRSGALAALERAGRLLPGHPTVALNRAALLADLRRPAEARDVIAPVVASRPGDADAALVLAGALADLGDFTSAIATYRRALDHSPDHPGLRLNLGNLLKRTGDRAGAADCYGAVLRRWPDHTGAMLAASALLQEDGSAEDAESLCRAALALDPNLTEAHLLLGNGALSAGRAAEAASRYRSALATDPAHGGAQLTLGTALQELARHDEARKCFGRALTVDPLDASARFRRCFAELPIIYRDMGEVDRAREAYAARLEELADHYAAAPTKERVAAATAVGGSQPFYLAYQGRCDLSLQTLYGNLVSGLMAERYPEFSRPLAARRRNGGPLRVGFVAGHIGRHSAVNVSLRGWADALDPARVALFCYHTGSGSDDETTRFASLSQVFRRGLGRVEDWAEAIRRDDLDALVFGDVGMDPMAVRLAALRLAPVQAMSTGHPVTTGLPTMDLYLSSALMEPPGAQAHYRETLVPLPNLGYAYRPLDPPAVPLTRADLGLPEDAPVFWCCQSLFKYLPCDDDLFVRIAARLPDALFLFIDYMPAPRVALTFRRRLAAAFARAGLDADRHCRFLPQMDLARFHAVAGLTDIFLDNPSWSGHNTALEALPHGLPIVTLPGALMRQRHSAAILEMIGVRETIAPCRDGYVEIAVRLGSDRRLRADLRQAMRRAAPQAFHDSSAVRALESVLEQGGSA